MRITIDATPADLACPDCGERAHKALDGLLRKAGAPGLAKGGEVDALLELEELLTRQVDKRLRALAKVR